MARLAPAALYEQMKRQKFVIAGPNVIESEEHVMRMAKSAKAILGKFDVLFIFKTSFDKANRTSAESYRGVSAKEATHIFQRVRTELGIPVITDVHEPHQCKLMADCVDILQIPAFLCRQTDLIIAAAETGLVLHIKKGQFCHADALHKTVQKAATAGNELCILCERGTFFGYQDIVVDPRNFERLKSDKNLVSMDITHCLQQPAQKSSDGVVKSGGERYLIPTMGKMAFALGCHGVFLETHDRPDESLCDAPTQWPLEKLEWLLEHIGCERKPSFLAAKLVPLVRSFETLTESAAFGELCEKLSCCACTAAGPKQSAYFSGIGKSRLAAQHACELLKSIGVNAGFLCPIQAGQHQKQYLCPPPNPSILPSSLAGRPRRHWATARGRHHRALLEIRAYSGATRPRHVCAQATPLLRGRRVLRPQPRLCRGRRRPDHCPSLPRRDGWSQRTPADQLGGCADPARQCARHAPRLHLLDGAVRQQPPGGRDWQGRVYTARHDSRCFDGEATCRGGGRGVRGGSGTT